MNKTLSEWLSYIESCHPKEIDMGLERVASVFKALELDFARSKVLTVAGTNGKGTTCRTIETLLNSVGVTTGVYSSPHLFDFNERVRINGLDADDEGLCEACAAVETARGSTSLSYFEFATLISLYCFAKNQVDVIILEVGLGGRLDATNIIDADVAVITSIGLDHQDWLGDTVQAIAIEKAGIIKPASRVVIGFEPESVGLQLDNFQYRDCWRRGKDFAHVQSINDNEYSFQLSIEKVNLGEELHYHWSNFHIPAQNVSTAIVSAWSLSLELPEKHAEKLRGLLSDIKRVEQLIDGIKMPGRCQILGNEPTIITDVAHNQQAAAYLRHQLEKRLRTEGENSQLHFVVAMLKDKNIEQTLSELAFNKANWYVCDSNGTRAESATRLKNALLNLEQASILDFSAVSLGLESALERAKSTDIICVFGSFFTVAEATEYMKSLENKNE